MKNRQLLFASVLLSCAPVALFAGSNPKATGEFTFISNVDNTSTAYMLLNAQQTGGTSYIGKGSAYFKDGVGVLNLDIQFVNVVGNTACFASQVAEGSNYAGQSIGNWYVNKVVDNGEPGVGHDQISGSGLAGDAATAYSMVASCASASFQAPNLTITSGNIQVHQ
jgi:hypothetical protein